MLVMPKKSPGSTTNSTAFQTLTPPNCHFRASRIWSRETKKKTSPCMWCVLYTVVNPQMGYLGGTQARELRKQLNKFKPLNACIVDYEFYENHSTGEQGWLFVWKVECDHTPNFYKLDNICKGELSAVTMGTVL